MYIMEVSDSTAIMLGGNLLITAIFSTFRKIPKVNIKIRIPVIKVRINFSARKQIPKEVWTDWYSKLHKK